MPTPICFPHPAKGSPATTDRRPGQRASSPPAQWPVATSPPPPHNLCPVAGSHRTVPPADGCTASSPPAHPPETPSGGSHDDPLILRNFLSGLPFPAPPRIHRPPAYCRLCSLAQTGSTPIYDAERPTGGNALV